MTEEVKLQERQEVLIFVQNPNKSLSQIEEPIGKGMVIRNELSDDMSYHGSPTYYRIYTVVDENGKYYKGTYMFSSSGCGDYFFKTEGEHKNYLEFMIRQNEEKIQKAQNNIKDLEERLKQYEKNMETMAQEVPIVEDVKPDDEMEPEPIQAKEAEDEPKQEDIREDVDGGDDEEDKEDEYLSQTPKSLKDLVNPLLWGNINYEDVARVGKTTPKYKLGEIVNLNTWGGMKYGFEVKDIKVTYHNRMEEYVWGYYLYKEGESTSFSFTYIPQGYLRKVEEEKEVV